EFVQALAQDLHRLIDVFHPVAAQRRPEGHGLKIRSGESFGQAGPSLFGLVDGLGEKTLKVAATTNTRTKIAAATPITIHTGMDSFSHSRSSGRLSAGRARCVSVRLRR